jgi:hypothetical protein
MRNRYTSKSRRVLELHMTPNPARFKPAVSVKPPDDFFAAHLCIYTHYSRYSSFAKPVSTGYSATAMQTKTFGDNMPDSAALSTRFRLYVQKHIRAAANWKAGQKLAFIPKGKDMLLLPVPEFEDLRGIAKGENQQGFRDRQDHF